MSRFFVALHSADGSRHGVIATSRAPDAVLAACRAMLAAERAAAEDPEAGMAERAVAQGHAAALEAVLDEVGGGGTAMRVLDGGGGHDA